MNDDDIVSAVYPAMGYDASAVGDQEFINGLGYFKEKLYGKIDFLSSNLSLADPEMKIMPYKIVTVPNGIRVGITAVNFHTNFMYLKRNGALKEEEISVSKAFDSLREVLSELKGTSDVIVVLSHLNEEGLTKLLDQVEGYDLVIGGNNGFEYKYERRISDRILVQNGRDGEKVGKVTFTAGRGKKAVFGKYELIKVLAAVYERNAGIEKIIRDLEN